LDLKCEDLANTAQPIQPAGDLLNSDAVIAFHDDDFAARYEALVNQDIHRLTYAAIQLYDRSRGEFQNIPEGSCCLPKEILTGNSSSRSKSMVREGGARSPVWGEESSSAFAGVLEANSKVVQAADNMYQSVNNLSR
jgi:hypothetical protein